jgi:hypothetical protein
MLRNRKSSSRLRLLSILTLLSVIGSWVVTAADDVPVGYKVDRYQQIWEHNPFTVVTPVAQSAPPNVFDKLVLVSWLNDGGNDIVFVQNIETNEVQKITKAPNSNNFRLVAIHKAANPKDAEVVLSNGTDEGPVKFRVEAAAPSAPQVGQQQPIPAAGVPNQIQAPATATTPVLARQIQAPLNPQQVTPQTQPAAAGLPPRASEIRRKRITPRPVTEQPVGVPTPAENIPGQPQTH